VTNAEKKLSELKGRLIHARAGFGPLLQRDYWAVIDGCQISSREVMHVVRQRFPGFPPEDLVRFEHPEPGRALEVGDEMRIHIRMEGETAVCVVHSDDNSLTLATLKGHPEAGRITFGAYPNDAGDVVFHIRSCARSSSRFRRAGFLAAGDPMQTNTWTDFIDRLAHTVGDGVIGPIHADVIKIEDEKDENDDQILEPTFIARG
jgi:hypothetical protein